jgi:hypothetical protein
MAVTPDISAEDLEQINLLREHVKDKVSDLIDFFTLSCIE